MDKDLLKILLTPNGRISSKAIADKLGVPATTVQRRRRKLEDDLLTITYSLDLKRFGWHRVDFLIATEKGRTIAIAKQLSKLDEVVYVGRSIGQQTIDLHVQAILEGNADILRIMEQLKSMPGIKDVVWSEIVQVVGKKPSVPLHIIDKL
ncbi:transcriptional regulator [Candidatus Nitrososphaera evergladensis SR1]|uniref:Transcriptional regulator n=1 Tax=Candidatus Nitrososphaera evergladensis SR1 TaxID=1459636 RepID=A0A075MQB6_9ARCH|nr:AsnC family transcriptional regulator [Candidatus Nitrososphaera evergladensis]AIF83393.1 transcriptional regulator [Candidatus Nitrososphaera evergladensis SR1]